VTRPTRPRVKRAELENVTNYKPVPVCLGALRSRTHGGRASPRWAPPSPSASCSTPSSCAPPSSPPASSTIKETIWWPAKRNESTPDGAAGRGPAAGVHQSANTGDDQPQINLSTARAVPLVQATGNRACSGDRSRGASIGEVDCAPSGLSGGSGAPGAGRPAMAPCPAPPHASPASSVLNEGTTLPARELRGRHVQDVKKPSGLGLHPFR
jgi:hypothetical protein